MIDTPWPDTPDLIITIDFAGANSYLALAPSLAMIAKLNLQVRWCHLPGPALPDPERYPGSSRSDRHRFHRATYQRMDLHRYAHAAGLDISALDDHRDTRVLADGLTFIMEHQPEQTAAYLAVAFDAYWSRGPIDVAATLKMLTQTGVRHIEETSFVRDPAGISDRTDAITTYLKALGLFNMPSYIIGDELFIGRAHLPMIEWRLTGEAGPKPI
jgi:2-hydroxychromene-2-carboxylate isomerase